MTSFKRITMIALAFFFTALLCNLFGWGDDDTVSVLSGDYDNVTSLFHNNCWCIVANEDTAHAIWTFETTIYEIWYARSYDSTETWEDSVKLSGSGIHYQPAIAIVGDTIHAIWNASVSGLPSILYRKSTDKGASWGAAAANISDDQSYAKANPCIAANGSNVYVAWKDARGNPSGWKIYFDYSSNNGADWNTDTILGSISSGENCDFPSVSVYGSNVDIAFQHDDGSDCDIKHRRSSNGTGWSSLHNITDGDTFDQYHPSIATSSSYVLVTYEHGSTEFTNVRIWAARSNNGGSNWWLHQVDNTAGDYDQIFPNVNYVDANAHVVWEDDRDGDYKQIYYAPSYNSGWTWASSTRISYNNSYNSHKPTISSITDDDDSDKKNVYVAWTEDYTAKQDYAEVLADFNQYDYIVGFDPQSPGGGQQAGNVDQHCEKSYTISIAPNPMYSHTLIKYETAGKKYNTVAVFDIAGRKVRTLFEGEQAPGFHCITWDGKNDKGSNTESGIYFIEAKGTGRAKVIKF